MERTIKQVAENLLGRALTEEDGMNVAEIEQTEISLGLTLPETLRDFYLLVGNVEMFISSFECFIKPSLESNKLVFLEENQSVCYWATDALDAENGMVYVCNDLEADTPEWHPEKVTLNEFLQILMYYQCAQGGYEYGSAVYECNFDSRDKYVQFLAEVTKEYEKVVEHNGLVIYWRPGKLLWHFADENNNIEDTIFASTLTADDMREFGQFGFQRL